LLRDHNRGLVLNLLRTQGPLSRTDLAQKTGLAPSVLTRLIRSLLQEQLVREVGKAKSNGGRRPTLLSLNPGWACAIGLKVEKNRLLGARVDLAGNIQAHASLPFPTGPSPDLLYRRAAQVVRKLAHGRILGVGIGISGFVDPREGVDLYSPILGWREVPVRAPLEQELGLPVWVENDVNALTLAECWFGAGRRFRDFVCVTVGEGIGAGVVIGGQLYRGAAGGAGELGHTTLHPEGPRCRCGEQGCLEVYASDQFLLSQARRLGFPDIPGLAQAARRGHQAARAAFAEMGRALGIGCKNLVNLLNPEAIVVGGERLDAWDLFRPAFEEEVRRHSFPKEAEELAIVPAQLGEDGFLIGAATLAVQEFFRLPTEGSPVWT
jgi:predicted NBD/HSP70 family sugar kinase